MFRLKKLDKFIFKQFGLLFIGAFFICQFVLMMQFLWKYVETLIGKGLSVDVLAQFFLYLGLMLVPQALPLAILLSSLITFGNLGESSELTAIKAAGISVMKSFRLLIVTVVIISLGSFYFQNVITPEANKSVAQLLLSMKQKSPELEIPEGIFYDGIPDCNLFVQKKDVKTGMLYGVMIYKLDGGYENAAIILADSGMLQSTAEKKHLVMTLHNGEWFENMRSQGITTDATVPYRRETFIRKKIILDFDGDFNMADAGVLAGNEKAKSLKKISHDVDSMKHEYDSIGKQFYYDVKLAFYGNPGLAYADSVKAVRMAADKNCMFDSIYGRLSDNKKLAVVDAALRKVQREVNDLDFKGMLTSDGDRMIRVHNLEAVNKVTLALSCLLFFFIGAPLGTIIRKGGLGVPVIISVLVFILYLVFDNSGTRMVRGGMWAIWFGKSLAWMVLAPLAVFVSVKANNDSAVFNVDVYRNFFMKIFGLRMKRAVFRKEVIIETPDYAADAAELEKMNNDITAYAREHNLLLAPNVKKVFFEYQKDNDVERINEKLEQVIENLSNTSDRTILSHMNEYPFMAVKAHTRPFERKWLNVVSAIIVPAGLFFYLRMWRFRLRLLRDLRTVKQTNEKIVERIRQIGY